MISFSAPDRICKKRKIAAKPAKFANIGGRANPRNAGLEKKSTAIFAVLFFVAVTFAKGECVTVGAAPAVRPGKPAPQCGEPVLWFANRV